MSLTSEMSPLYNTVVDFRTHLLTYLPQEEVDGILSAQKKEQVHGLLLNTEKVDPEAFTQAFHISSRFPMFPMVIVTLPRNMPLASIPCSI